MKKWIHPTYIEWVDVNCICWNSFKINTSIKWPIKVDTCPSCNSVRSWIKETKLTKGRAEKFNERQKRIDSINKKK